MALSTFSELKTAVADFLNRSDLTSVIPTFISLAEADFNRRIRHRKMLERSTATLDSHFTALPTDFLEAYNVQLNTSPLRPLEYITPEYADELRHGRFQAAGQPYYFTIIGDTLEAIPVPDTSYTIELTYYKAIAALSDAAPSNWLLSSHPDLYLYASLAASAPYLKEDERLPMWIQWKDKMIADLNAQSERSEVSGSVLKIRARLW